MHMGPDGLEAIGFRPEDGGEFRLLEAQREKQEEARKALEEAIDGWTLENISEEKAWDQSRMKELLSFLQSEHGDKIDIITEQMRDLDMYPDRRPSIRLHNGSEEVPRVIVYGWREEDAGHGVTVIHDHGISKGAVLVHEGAVEERVYGIDRNEWEELVRNNNTEGVSLNITNSGRTTYTEGQSKTFKAPFLHALGGDGSHDFSSSVHAYHPPVDSLAVFEVQGDRLVLTGRE
jgi:hypothetical protein